MLRPCNEDISQGWKIQVDNGRALADSGNRLVTQHAAPAQQKPYYAVQLDDEDDLLEGLDDEIGI